MLVICTLRNNIVADKEYINDDENHAPDLEEMELDFLNTANKPICEYQKDDSTPEQDVDSGEIGYVQNKV